MEHGVPRLSRHRVLAISQERDQLRRIVKALTDAGAEVDAILDTKTIGSQQIGHRYVFIDIGNARKGDYGSNLEFVLSNSSEQTHVAVITDDAPLGEFTNLLSNVRVNHIISREELEHGVFVTAQKLLSGDIFGIERYLAKDTEVHYVRLNDFEGRGNAIDTILEFADKSGIRPRLRQGIGQVCEELLMNALYDAPVDDTGAQMFAEIDPHDRVAAQSPRPVSIRYASTESLFAVAVRDRYGRLAKDTIIAYIDKCLNSPNQIDRKTYGAGLGLYMVANAAAGYIVNVAYGIATEVICTFDRKSKLPLRLVGVFVHPSQPNEPADFSAIPPKSQNNSQTSLSGE